MFDIPDDAVGLKLYRIPRGASDAIACEAIRFPRGKAAISTLLMRARIAGRVELEGNIEDHFLDILDENQSILATVALDSRSYGSLKNKWMRCRVER